MAASAVYFGYFYVLSVIVQVSVTTSHVLLNVLWSYLVKLALWKVVSCTTKNIAVYLQGNSGNGDTFYNLQKGAICLP